MSFEGIDVCSKCKEKVQDLQCLFRYQFRIVAVNKAGESWPSYETKPHLARHKNLAPTIDKGAGGSKSVKVRAVFEWNHRIRCCLKYMTCNIGEPDDSVEDQREGGTPSAVQLVEGW